jgi:predicted nucleotidyltransferase
MGRYRVFYLERKPNKPGSVYIDPEAGLVLPRDGSVFKETDWEETVEGHNPGDALDMFFREHAGASDRVLIIEEDGKGYPVPGISYDPDRTYVWIEDDNLMEYQGMAEAAEGSVTCPLCDGEGEVDEEIAEEFATIWSSDEYVEEEA